MYASSEHKEQLSDPDQVQGVVENLGLTEEDFISSMLGD